MMTYASIFRAAVCLALYALFSGIASGHAAEYHDGDVKAFQAIIAEHKLDMKADAPASWRAAGHSGPGMIAGAAHVEWSETSPRRVTAIYLPGMNISGRIDFRPFAEIRRIACPVNGLREILISGLSKLEYVDINSNKKLAALDLSGLPSLKLLWCDNTAISRLDLSGTPSLERLFVIVTQLDELDISPCPNLKLVDCEGTGIKSIDLGRNPRLVSAGENYPQRYILNPAHPDVKAEAFAKCAGTWRRAGKGHMDEEKPVETISIDEKGTFRTFDEAGKLLQEGTIEISDVYLQSDFSYEMHGRDGWSTVFETDGNSIIPFASDEEGTESFRYTRQ